MMKLFRALLSVVWSLALVVGLLPSASVFASTTDVPSWGDPNINYGAKFFSAEGNFTQSGLAFGQSRPAQLDRWQAVFTDFTTQQVTNTMDKYDVYDLQNQQPGDNLDTKNGYGLLPVEAPDKIRQFVQMANGDPDFVLSLLLYILQHWQDVPSLVSQSVFYQLTDNQNNTPMYVRSAMLVMFSGGRLDHIENTPTQPFDPGGINGTAYFLTSPWPKITQAVVQGDTVHIAFTTYGLNFLHHPKARITNGTDEITKDFGDVNKDGSHDTYNGTWDIPVSQVTQKLGPLDKLTVIVEDGFGRTAQAPLGQNLAITYNWAANYTVPYTAGQPASFTQALVLTRQSGTAPNPADKFLNDTLQWSYSVDGGPWQPLTVLPDTAKVFDASGKLKDKIVIRTDTLNSIPGRQWGGGTHKIRVKVSASPGDQGQYLFSSEDSGGPGPEAVVTVTFAEAHRFGEVQKQPNGGKLIIQWAHSLPDPTSPTGRGKGGLPDQVSPCGTFVAPVEISNNGNTTINTTVDFVIDGTVVIKRTFESRGDGPPPPPVYMSFPLHGVVTKSFTLPPKGVVWWDVGYGGDRNLSYTIEGYEGPAVGPGYHDEVLYPFIQLPTDGPIGPLTGPLDVGMPASKSDHSYDPLPHYAAHIQAIPRDPEDYLHSPIDEWIGVTDPSGHARVRLVQ